MITAQIAIGLSSAAGSLDSKAVELDNTNQSQLADAYRTVARLLRLIITDEPRPEDEKPLFIPEPADLFHPAMDHVYNFLRYPGKVGGRERSAWQLQAFIDTADQLERWQYGEDVTQITLKELPDTGIPSIEPGPVGRTPTPQNVQAVVSGGNIIVSCDPVDGADSYDFYRDYQYRTTKTQPQWIDSGRSAGSYDYTIKAVDDSRSGDDRISLESQSATATIVSNELNKSGMLKVDLGADKAIGAVTTNDFDAWMSPLAKQYVLGGGGKVGVSTVAGRKAIQCEISPDNATDSRPTNRVDTGYYLPSSGSYRMSQWVYIPPNFDGGGSRVINNVRVPYGTGKLGFGLYGGQDVSGGTIDPAGWSLRWVYDVETNDDLTLALYDYSTDRASVWGDKHELPNKLVRGAWNFMAYDVVCNPSSSSSNGRIRAWQSDDAASPDLIIENKKMMGSGTPRIDRVKVEVFMGGSGTNAVEYYSPASNQTISFADIYIGSGTF